MSGLALESEQSATDEVRREDAARNDREAAPARERAVHDRLGRAVRVHPDDDCARTERL